MKKIGFIGNVNRGTPKVDGQIQRTQTILNFLEKEKTILIKKCDTSKYKKWNPFLYLKILFVVVSTKKTIITLTSTGVMRLIKYLSFFNLFFNKELIFIMIGGKINNKIFNSNRKLKQFRKFKKIYVQTSLLQSMFFSRNIMQVEILYNFRINDYQNEALKVENEKPFKVCTFSRIIYEKGIIDAINAVKKINSKYKKPVVKLDIYGEVDIAFKDKFEKELLYNKDYVDYLGSVAKENTSKVLRNYLVTLFPTFYEGEGFSGTILDSMTAGVPIIASNWKYNSEFIIDTYNGNLFEVKNVDDLVDKILLHMNNLKLNFEMRKNCIVESQKYNPEVIMRPLLDIL